MTTITITNYGVSLSDLMKSASDWEAGRLDRTAMKFEFGPLAVIGGVDVIDVDVSGDEKDVLKYASYCCGVEFKTVEEVVGRHAV